ncbi:hypothetical protein AAES_119455 [Amazona aestiva]|uniref:Uncharacterized protein n=1 Tax=Amazona aestiva TaxID=12930 RepID=A0A0Q3M5T3_AMAAE|nr:hypothetical protein AAES_119455 [Amazona aestiva]
MSQPREKRKAERALFNTVQNLQKEKHVPGSEGRGVGGVAAPAPSTGATPPQAQELHHPKHRSYTSPRDKYSRYSNFNRNGQCSYSSSKYSSYTTPGTSTAATQAPVTSTAATQTTVIITADKPEDQLVPIPVAPVRKRKRKKAARKIKQDEETTYSPPGTASDQESSSHDEELTSRLRTSTELRHM